MSSSTHSNDSAQQVEPTEDMIRDRRECTAYLRSDLYRLDDAQERRSGEQERPDYDCHTSWRYVNPPRSVFVALSYGERHLRRTGRPSYLANDEECEGS